ncbi:hypothetical protein F4860DRAFT_502312 [Xylaria cubensis]|nr:hypothetical protein F4860DRAFT_502312 [Xylaria cubensis]
MKRKSSLLADVHDLLNFVVSTAAKNASDTIQAVTVHCDVPLVFQRIGTRSSNRADLDNQMVTYMNINAISRFVPPERQSFIGTVIVARKDKKPLLPHHLEDVWMYCDYILYLFGEGEGTPRHLYSRRAFEEWWGQYCEKQKQFRVGTGGEVGPDD